MDTNKYAYKVIWSEDDEEFVGLCSEFPSMSYLDEDRNKALAGITEAIDFIVKELKKEEKFDKIPQPLSLKTYSGKLSVRIPPGQHRKIALAAAEEGVSLNRYISEKLSA